MTTSPMKCVEAETLLGQTRCDTHNDLRKFPITRFASAKAATVRTRSSRQVRVAVAVINLARQTILVYPDVIEASTTMAADLEASDSWKGTELADPSDRRRGAPCRHRSEAPGPFYLLQWE